MVTLKFGGTSVQDSSAVQALLEIVKSRSGKRLVVVSALAKITDQLLGAAEMVSHGKSEEMKLSVAAMLLRHQTMMRELQVNSETVAFVTEQFESLLQFYVSLATIGELSPRSLDRIVAVGELCSSRIVADSFRQAGVRAKWADARTLVKTDAQFTAAQVDFDKTQIAVEQNLKPLFQDNDVVITGGFVASSDFKGQQVTTTLGRGGSDYSAAILGAALQSEKIEIWTDVNGVLTTDPRMVPEAKRIIRLSFDEAAELAYFGAKVLHPATIVPAVKKNIPVLVLNSKNPKSDGTVITSESLKDQNVIKALACKRNVTLINIHSSRMLGASGFLQSVFSTFARHNVSIDLISTSEVNVSLTLDTSTNTSALAAVVSELEQFSTVSKQIDLASVAAVGKGICEAAGVGARIFGALKGHNICMISMGSSEVNISLVVKDKEVIDVIRKLHVEFFSKDLNKEVFGENC